MSLAEGRTYYVLGVPGVPPTGLDAGVTERPDDGVRKPGLHIHELYKEDEKTKQTLENDPEGLAQSVIKGITLADKKSSAYRRIYCCEDEPTSAAKGNND